MSVCVNYVIGKWKKFFSFFNSFNYLDMCLKRGVVRKSCEKVEIGNYF